LLNVSPLGVSRFADSVGKIANGFADAGGAAQGYDGSAAPVPQVSNYMQLMDPRVLKALGASFNPRTNTVDFQ
jgi:hypothetical protein